MPPIELIGAKAVAEYLYVGRPIVGNWIRRRLPGMPQPYAIIRHKGGAIERYWLPSSLPLWARWYVDWQTRRPGR
jgi:hypothetical protein